MLKEFRSHRETVLSRVRGHVYAVHKNGAENSRSAACAAYCNRETRPNPASSQPSTKVTFNETILFSTMNLAVFLPYLCALTQPLSVAAERHG